MENKRKSKTVDQSSVVIQQLVMPNHTNPHNTIFGGVVMSWIDMAAAMVAQKHCNRQVVTVHVDDIFFKAPIKIGDHVIVSAALNYVGNTSMLIGVKVEAVNPVTEDKRSTTTAYLTFVALDDVGKPIQIPDVVPETEDQKRRYCEAKERLESKKRKPPTKC
jgi:acyl-CoA hydrolase